MFIKERQNRKGGGQKFFCFESSQAVPLVFLLEVCLREGKAVGSEKGKVLGCALC
jgi:hypothetical protein